jgi:hypothetical protein
LASLQGGHSQKSIMAFDMFEVKFQSSISSIVKDLTLQVIVVLKNIQISYGETLDFHDLLFQGLTQLLPFFFSNQRIMIENQNPFPFNTLGFETHCSNSLVLPSYASLD